MVTDIQLLLKRFKCQLISLWHNQKDSKNILCYATGFPFAIIIFILPKSNKNFKEKKYKKYIFAECVPTAKAPRTKNKDVQNEIPRQVRQDDWKNT